MDVRSLRKTQVAAAAPSCILLFDGLRVEFAATSTRPAAPPVPPPSPGCGIGADSAAECQTVLSTPSPAGSPYSALTVRGGVNQSASAMAGGVDARLNVSGLEVDGGVDGRVSPSAVVPQLSVVETVRVLSVEVGDKRVDA